MSFVVRQIALKSSGEEIVRGSTYGMREMTGWGMDCVLVRDLTDILFAPGAPPQMPHETALQMVVEHLEKHLVSTITSGELAAALANIKP